MYVHVCPNCGYENYRACRVVKVRCSRCRRVFSEVGRYVGDVSKDRPRATRRECEVCGGGMYRIRVLKMPAGWICFNCGNLVFDKWVIERIGKGRNVEVSVWQ